MARRLVVFLGVVAIAWFSARHVFAEPSADARVRALADDYLRAYLDRHPEWITIYGISGHRHDRLDDNSLDALARWQSTEDRFLDRTREIDPYTIADHRLRATYAIVRESLESSVALRVCRSELWPVSGLNGWQTNLAFLATIQPVGNDVARRDALARWTGLPKVIDTEIANLREGMMRGYTAPRVAVGSAVAQLRAIVFGPMKDSPFDSPSQRDDSPEFRMRFDALVADRIVPAVKRYLEFLESEYLPAARTSIGLSDLPDGAACYAGSIRAFSSLPKSAADVHRIGLEQMERVTADIRVIGMRSFKTTDVSTLLQTVRTDERYFFKDRDDLIAYDESALDRARKAASKWFARLPRADVRLEPYPPYREKSGANEYTPPAEDGSHPAVFFVSAYRADTRSRVDAEATTFHETIPGHHLQMARALERQDIHPIGRYIYNSGYAEGWGLYAEQLADEMHLYSSPLDRVGMLSLRAFRAARLVVDTGIHAMGWSRAQAIAYMLAHTAEEPRTIADDVDRYIVMPGQATSYMLGMLEIRAAREEAERRMGRHFDVREFHERVLEDGAVPLTYLRAKITAWIRGGAS